MSVASAAVQQAAPSSLSRTDATRFLQRASFGARPGEATALMTLGIDAWYDDQLQRESAISYYDGVVDDKISGATANWGQMLTGQDQLRKRVAYALSQIFVASGSGVGGYQIAAYMDLLEEHALGNFRDLLEHVTRSFSMGTYLTYIYNQKADPETGRQPDENYAREIMQLFTIGLWELEPDGSRTLVSGQPVPTYDLDDILGLARVFTGWRYPRGVAPPTRYRVPMVMEESDHESGAKTFLGVTIPPNTLGEASLEIALDTLVAHPNVGPFIGRQLIQRLVTSNPSAEYTRRVAAVFDDDGTGTRGNIAAIVKAILIDPEAWQANPPDTFGKLREPTLRFTVVARALGIDADNDDWGLENESDTAAALGQQPYEAPSVFNFYRPGYVPPQSELSERGLVGPEFQIVNETSAIGWINWLSAQLNRPKSTHSFEIDDLLALTDDVGALADEVASRLVPAGISATLREIVVRNITDVTNSNTDFERLEKVMGTVLLIAASTDFLHER